MPGRTTKRRPKTVARLLDAALELFAEQGFGGTTIAQVCEHAGFTRGAYYSNFTTMDALFFALFEEHSEDEVARYDRALAELDDNDVSLDRVMKQLAQVDKREATWFLVSAEFTLHAIRNPDARRILAGHHARLEAHVVDLLTKLLERTGRTTTFDIHQIARLFVATRNGSLAQSLVEPQKSPAGHLEETFWPVMFRAISSPASSAF